MSRFIDKRLSALEAYVPGEQPKPGEFIKLNTNEFPYQPVPGVEKAAVDSVANMNLYSDLSCKALTESFFKVFGYGGKNVVFTNGSDEALYLSFLTFCGKDRGVAYADITYGFYSVYADLCGIESTVIPLDNELSVKPEDYFGLDKTIVIANPNAPTGKMLTVDEIESIVKNNLENIVIIDEAYTDFSGQTCVNLVDKYDNLVIIGTFSKSRGMAGARLGYLIACEDLVNDIQKVKFSINPYNVNSITQAVGKAVLDNNEYYKKCVREICDTRDAFSENIKSLGFEVIPSKTNFVFAKHNTVSGKVIAAKLRERGILIRRFDKERINEYLRISIGTPEQMKNVYSALNDIVGGNL